MKLNIQRKKGKNIATLVKVSENTNKQKNRENKNLISDTYCSMSM